jgi:hypothetical protein
MVDVEGFWEELKATCFSRRLMAGRDFFVGAAVLLPFRVPSRSKLPTRASTPLNEISWDGLAVRTAVAAGPTRAPPQQALWN